MRTFVLRATLHAATTWACLLCVACPGAVATDHPDAATQSGGRAPAGGSGGGAGRAGGAGGAAGTSSRSDGGARADAGTSLDARSGGATDGRRSSDAVGPAPIADGAPPVVSSGAYNATGLRVRSDGHGFEEDGRPFLWQGTFELTMAMGDTRDQIRDTLQLRQRQGFTVVHVVWGGDVSYQNGDQETAFVGDDITKPNPKYFDLIELIVDRSRELGMYVVLGLEQHRDPYTEPEKCRAYATYLGQRFGQKPNVLWSLAHVYTGDRPAVIHAVAEGLLAGATGMNVPFDRADPLWSRQLMTIDAESPGSSSKWFQTEPWLAYNGHSSLVDKDHTYDIALADFTRTPAKPSVNVQPQHPGNEVDPLRLRREAFADYLAGAGIETWEDHEELARVAQIWRAQRWWRFVPDNDRVSDSGHHDGLERVLAARSLDGDAVVVYFPGNDGAAIHLDGAVTGARVQAVWFDPRSGAQQTGASYDLPTANVTPPAGWVDAFVALSAAPR